MMEDVKGTIKVILMLYAIGYWTEFGRRAADFALDKTLPALREAVKG